ncbi:ADP-ribosylation factor-related protein [Heterostelium album PN500]|uniref:ADP-ribosylation factor-related protein n=1 Tax=Heterostelium pallidum (strain ATCC 26659 / Pp 5 / PN500) TaxID=670386 RepID=D3BKE9_HETP5|nr:ADP-ribosylation factor-related protein [Heterostelium album PN500]EFA78379.1 ADP-ribosylation factor-related protein [Heterostelium album PN500]|eukprot:XP_020430504.1 ADP-ribosylation factor-related protein [Heterostelium album PN500]
MNIIKDYFSNWSIFNQKQTRNYNVVFTGMTGVGKTSLLYKMKLGEFIGDSDIGRGTMYNVEYYSFRDRQFTLWELKTISPHATHVNLKIDVLILVVDSSNDRLHTLQETKQYFYDALKDALQYSGEQTSILILANKCDQPNTSILKEIEDQLELPLLNNYIDNNSSTKSNHLWHIQAVSAKSGYGIDESLDWISNILELQQQNY